MKVFSLQTGTMPAAALALQPAQWEVRAVTFSLQTGIMPAAVMR